jgi:hypothetical protein
MSDRGKDPAPAFIFPFLTGRQQRELSGMLEKLSLSDSVADPAQLDVAFDAAFRFCDGWENITGPDGQPLPFSKENFFDLLAFQEVMELINRLFTDYPSIADKKK